MKTKGREKNIKEKKKTKFSKKKILEKKNTTGKILNQSFPNIPNNKTVLICHFGCWIKIFCH